MSRSQRLVYRGEYELTGPLSINWLGSVRLPDKENLKGTTPGRREANAPEL